MKIAVILTEFLKDYVESYFRSQNYDCEFSYFIYKNFSHVGELYLELISSYDGFLVSGPVPRAAILKRVPALPRPLVSFGSNALCYYETFFQVQYKEEDFYLKKGYFDLLEWIRTDVPLYHILGQGRFDNLIYQVYKNTSLYSLEQLCAMEEKIKHKHIRLWYEGKISYSVTRFSNIMPDLLKAGVKTYFVYPNHEILKESVSLLLQEIHLKTMLQNQNAITALNQQLSGSTSAVPTNFDENASPKELSDKDILFLSQKTGLSPSYIEKLTDALNLLDADHITSQALSSALNITPRSANRLLKKLLSSGVAEELSKQHSFTRGRPEKIYKILLL